MKAAPRWIPSVPEVTREALIVVAGAALAAFVVGNWPALREWIKAQWGDAQH